MCRQCSHEITPGRRCKQRSCIELQLCWQHLRQVYKLRIAPSQLQIDGASVGRGLFALHDKPLPTRLLTRLQNGQASASERRQNLVFAKGTKIAPYIGENLTKTQLDQRYDYKHKDGYIVEQTAPYAMDDHQPGTYRDALCWRNATAYANDARGSKKHNNSKMKFSVPSEGPFKDKRSAGTFELFATRDIFQGEEILWKYGKKYWKGGPIAAVKETKVHPQRSKVK